MVHAFGDHRRQSHALLNATANHRGGDGLALETTGTRVYPITRASVDDDVICSGLSLK